jgi:hypothetical protein
MICSNLHWEDLKNVWIWYQIKNFIEYTSFSLFIVIKIKIHILDWLKLKIIYTNITLFFLFPPLLKPKGKTSNIPPNYWDIINFVSKNIYINCIPKPFGLFNWVLLNVFLTRKHGWKGLIQNPSNVRINLVQILFRNKIKTIFI